MAEENLGEIYVKIRADVSNLEKEMDQVRRKVSRESDEMGKKLSFKAKFDNSIAVWRISELQKLREKLQREFDKKVSINVSSTSLDRTREKIAAVDARLKGVGESAEKTAGIFSSAFGKGLILAGGVTAFFSALKNSILAAQESAIAHAKVSQAVRTTGMAAGLTAKELFGLADELKKLTAIDDDTILTNITNNLLTFRNVSGDVFKRAQLAVLDLNAVIANGEIGSLTSQTIQLGKALQSPTTGLMFLTRAGISFNEQQKDQIKTLEQSGNLFEAQSLILDEVERQYGGQAKILALADGGFKKLNQTVDDVNEAIGKDLVGSATEGNGALQELADGFLAANEGIKVVNQGVGIFGALIDNLKNVITGGKAFLDKFLAEGIANAKAQYIKDMQEIVKKTRETYKELGLTPEPVKLTPITPQLDTTFGDEILANYQKQQTEIAQLRNKLKDVNLTTEERITLEKELTSILDKQKDKTNVDPNTKYIQSLVSSLDEYRNKIKLLNAELLKLGDGNSEKKVILTAELSKLQEQLDNEEIKLNLKVGKVDLEGGDIDTEGLMKQFAEDTNMNIAEGLQNNLTAIDSYYNEVGAKDEGYWNWKIGKIKQQSDAILEATNNEILAKEFQIIKTQELEQEYFDWKVEEWKKQNKVADAAFNALSSGMIEALQLIKIRTRENVNAVEGLFVNMANMFIAQVERMIAEWLTFQLISGIIGIIAAPFTGGASLAMAAHKGGEFLGTSLGITKMASGGSFIVPNGFPNDSYPMLVESGERVQVTPAGSVGSQDRLLSSIDNRLRALETLNKNLISKNFSPVIVANLELDGRKITKSVVSNINRMQKEGKDLTYL